MKDVSRRDMIKTVGAGLALSLVPAASIASTGVAQAMGIPVVTRLRAAHRTDVTPNFDRVVIDMSGHMPAEIWWEYVAKLVQDGSGMEVPIEGSKKFQISLHGATAHDDGGNSTLPQRTITPRLPIVRQVKLFSDFEGLVLVGIGLSRETRTRTLVIHDSVRQTVRAVVDFIIT